MKLETTGEFEARGRNVDEMEREAMIAFNGLFDGRDFQMTRITAAVPSVEVRTDVRLAAAVEWKCTYRAVCDDVEPGPTRVP